MKKFIMLLVLCSLNVVRADDLSLAIQESDLEKVTLCLQQETLVDPDYACYADLVDETITLRREQLIVSEKGLPAFIFTPGVKTRYQVGMLLASVGVLYGGIDKLSALYRLNYALNLDVPLSLPSFFFLAACVTWATRDKYEAQQKLYKNALAIKDLLNHSSIEHTS
ncbi:MAG: hypothetical protein NTX86_00495 [Candidatus Dependentiae bacterium]|nr:hypothetical protein [Candidatus Dependentiae bacterium]